MATPMIIAHRGGKALGPENTIGTMKKGLESGAHGFELDVWKSFHEELVVMHDATIDRTTSGKGEIAKMCLREIQKYDAGAGEKVPSLIQVLDAFSTTNARIFVEVKHPSAALLTAKVVDHYVQNKGYVQGQVVIISFLHQLLVMMREKHPKLVLGAGMKKVPESLAACGEYTGSKFILPSIDVLTLDLMKDAKDRGLRVIPWTCDTKEEIGKALSHEVDGLITSDPRLCAAA